MSHSARPNLPGLFPEFSASCARVFCVVAISLLASADPAVRAEDSTRVEKIFVPADNPKMWPKGDWIPIPSAELSILLQKLKPLQPAPAPVIVSEATYSAVLAGNVFRNGRLTARVQKLDDSDVYLPLDPMNIAVSKLAWTDREAVWGTDSQGANLLLVDRAAGALDAEWSLRGIAYSQITEFEFRLIPASASSLRLKVPNELTLTSSDGHISGPLASGERGWSDWKIDLGTRSTCRITVGRKPEQRVLKPVVFYDQETSFVAREADVEFRADFHVEVLDAPLQRLQFSLPTTWILDSISYGGELSLPWKQMNSRSRKRQQITVQLSDPLLGQGQTIRLRGRMPLNVNRNMPVPPVVLENSFFHSGSLAFRVAPPLQLKDFSVPAAGLKQTASVFDPTDGHTISFQQVTGQPEFQARVGYPNLVLSAEILSVVQTASKVWQLNSEVRWTAQSGSTYLCVCRLPLDWEVTDVRSAAPNDEVAHWSVATDLAVNERLVTVEFRDALRPSAPRAVQMFARRQGPPSNQSMDIPTVVPAECGQLRTLLAIRHSDRAAVRLEADAENFERITTDQVDETWSSSLLWGGVPIHEDTTTLFHSISLQPGGRMRLQTTEQPVKVRSIVTLSAEKERLSESLTLDCEPVDSPIERLLIYLTRTGSSPEWKLRDSNSDENSLQATRLPVSQHNEWSLPRFGELWEIRFAKTLSNQFTVSGTRERDFAVTDTATLAFVPAAVEFQGRVILSQKELPGLEIHTETMSPILEERPPGSQPADSTVGSRMDTGWQYQSPLDALQLSLQANSSDQAHPQVATASLRSWFAATPGGFDLHWARIRVEEPSGSRAFRFALAKPAEIIAVEVDSASVTPTQQGAEYFVPPLPTSTSREFLIHYRIPSAAGPMQTSRHVVLPQLRHVISQFDWEFSVEENNILVDGPKSLVLLGSLPSSSWKSRIFGSWARTVEANIFNPLSRESWVDHFVTRRTGRATTAEATSGVQFPTDASIYRAQSIHMPVELVVTIADRGQIHAVAWLVFWSMLVLGLIVRLVPFPHRSLCATIWFSIVTASFFVVPAAYAEIAGNCWFASVVTVLLPARLLAVWGRKQKKSDQSMVGSTISLHALTATSLLLAIVGMSTTTTGQDATRGNAAPASKPADLLSNLPTASVPRLLRILVPVDDPAHSTNSLPEIVYIDRSQYSELQSVGKTSQTTPPSYLIHNVEYTGSVDEQGTSLKLSSHISGMTLVDQETVKVVLNFQDANFGGPQVCQVNGEAQPILIDAQQGSYFVEVPAGLRKPFTIDLSMYPARIRETNANILRLRVPAVSSSRLRLEFSGSPVKVDLPGATGEVAYSAASRTLTGQLGRSDVLSVTWLTDTHIAPPAILYDAKVLCFVEVHPTHLRLKYRVQYDNVQGKLEVVYWSLPRNAVVRSVSSTVELNYFRTSEASGNGQLVIQLRRPVGKSFAVDSEIVIPLRQSMEDIRIPSLDLIRRTPDNTAAAITVGIAATPGFQVESPNVEQVELRAITPERFLQLWPAAETLRKPQFAFQSQSSTPLVVRLVPIRPERKALIVEAVNLSRRRLEWNVAAELEVSKAPAFQHVLRFDPRLVIDSISVSEDDAERLTRWSRIGDRLILFLNDKTTGIQSVAIKTHLPVQNGEWEDFPVIEFEDSVTTDKSLVVNQMDSTELTFESPEVLLPLEANDTQTSPDVRTTRRFRFAQGNELSRIRIVASERNHELVAARIFEQEKGTRWKVRTVIRIGEIRPSEAPLRIRVPPALSASVKASSMHGVAAPAFQPDGSIEFEIPLQWQNSVIVIESSFQPGKRGSEDLPALVVHGEPINEPFLVLIKADRVRLENSDARLVDAGVLPDWLAPFVETTANGPSVRVFQRESTPDGTWQITGLTARPAKTNAGVPLVETRLWLGSGNLLYGKTNFLTYGLEENLTITWPGDIMLRAAFLDGNPLSKVQPTNGEHTIALGSGFVVHAVTILWQQHVDETARRWVIPTISEIPTVASIRPDRALVTVVPLSGTKITSTTGWIRSSADERALDMLDAYLAINRRSFDLTGSFHEGTWEQVPGLARSLRRKLDVAGSAVVDEPDAPMTKTRRLKRELDELSLAARQLAPLPITATDKTQALQRRLLSELDPEISNEVFGRIPDSGIPSVGFVAIHQQLVYWGLTAATLIIVLCTLLLLPTALCIGWLQRQTAFSIAIIGCVCWLCLFPSVAGFAVFAGAAAITTRNAWEAGRSAFLEAAA